MFISDIRHMSYVKERPGFVVCLSSGGFDSAVLLHWCATRFRAAQPVYVTTGLRWERAELRALESFLDAYRSSPARGPAKMLPLHVVTLPKVAGAVPRWARPGAKVPGLRTPDSAVFLPGRNLALLGAAARIAAASGAGAIAMGTLASNPFPDGRPAFFRAFAKTASLGLGRPLRVVTPFRRWTKSRVAHFGIGLPLQHTLSCIAPVSRGTRAPIPCGRCNKCAERSRGLRVTDRP